MIHEIDHPRMGKVVSIVPDEVEAAICKGCPKNTGYIEGRVLTVDDDGKQTISDEKEKVHITQASRDRMECPCEKLCQAGHTVSKETADAFKEDDMWDEYVAELLKPDPNESTVELTGDNSVWEYDQIKKEAEERGEEE